MKEQLKRNVEDGKKEFESLLDQNEIYQSELSNLRQQLVQFTKHNHQLEQEIDSQKSVERVNDTERTVMQDQLRKM